MVQSGTFSSPSSPVQACQRSAVRAGMIDPAGCALLAAGAGAAGEPAAGEPGRAAPQEVLLEGVEVVVVMVVVMMMVVPAKLLGLEHERATITAGDLGQFLRCQRLQPLPGLR